MPSLAVTDSQVRGYKLRFFTYLRVAFVVFWLPGVAVACDYPAPVRAISATLVSLQDTSGQVAPFHRTRLRQALGRLDVPALQRELNGGLSRADRNALAVVLTLSAALANGNGRSLSPEGRDQARHLATAIRASCAANTQAKAASMPTDTSREHSVALVEGGAGTALTFRQSLARLSLIFTLYTVFLALVIGMRHQWKATMQAIDDTNTPPSGGRAFSPRKPDQVSGF